MKTITLYFLIACTLILGPDLSAQVLWLESDMKGTALVDRINEEVFEIGLHSEGLNFHSIPTFNQQAEILVDVPSLSQCQIFTVFQSKPGAKEALIWKLGKDAEDQLLFTDHRMFDYTNLKFMNFVNHSPDHAHLYCYQHYRSDFQTDQLHIGALPQNDAIPADSFKGNLAELIIFKRVLAPITRKAIESYLALKYSLPLQLGEDYLSMDGNKIWEYKLNKEFPHRIAGLGRDDRLQLYQKQSRSQIEGGSLVIGLNDFKKFNQENQGSISPNHYLLWSDDGNSLDFIKGISFPEKLERSWKLNALKFDDNQIFFQLDHDAIVKDLSQEEQLWLALSDGEKNEFRIETDRLLKMNLDNGLFSIKDVDIQAKVYHFSFIKAPKFWAALEFDEIACRSEVAGMIKIKPMGGRAPYQVKLSDGSMVVYEDSFTEEDFFVIDDLSNNRYELEISDKDDKVYKTSVNINSDNINLANLDLSTNVTKHEIEKYFQSFQEDHNVQYSWILPNGEFSSGLDVEFDESGVYVLEMSKDDCKAWKRFEVIAPENNIVDMFINPNPSSTGFFHLSAELKRTAGYTIDITTMDGRKIFFQQFSDQKYIDYYGQLSDPGIYNVRLGSNGSQLSKKLIIVN